MKPIKVSVPRGIFLLRPWPTFITLVMLVVLLGLGTWQVQRLQWKQNLIAIVEKRTHEKPVDVSTIKETDADYHPASASGLFQHDHEFYLTSISLKGEGGYHVLTPLQLDDGRYLLVDRGWVPYDHKSPDARNDGQLFGPVTIDGILRVPQHSWTQPTNKPEQNIWYSIDLAAMPKSVGLPQFLPYVLEADATRNPGGYPVGGQTRVTFPNNHLSYAITWYALALALLVIYGVSGYRKVS